MTLDDQISQTIGDIQKAQDALYDAQHPKKGKPEQRDIDKAQARLDTLNTKLAALQQQVKTNTDNALRLTNLSGNDLGTYQNQPGNPNAGPQVVDLNAGSPQPKKSNTGNYVVAGLVALALGLATWFFVRRKKKGK